MQMFGLVYDEVVSEEEMAEVNAECGRQAAEEARQVKATGIPLCGCGRTLYAVGYKWSYDLLPAHQKGLCATCRAAHSTTAVDYDGLWAAVNADQDRANAQVNWKASPRPAWQPRSRFARGAR